MSIYQYSAALLPRKYQFAYDLMDKINSSFWTLDKVGSLSNDVIDFKECESGDKRVIETILKIFTQLEISVAKNYTETFIPKFKNAEIRMALVAIANNESIHVISYQELARELHFPDDFQTEFKKIKELSDKAEFIEYSPTEFVSEQLDLINLAKSVFGEGISLFGSFTILLNYQKHGKFLKFGDITAYSLIDETSHVNFISKLFREIAYVEYHTKLTDEIKAYIYEMARHCVRLENNFIDIIYGDLDTIHGLKKSDLKSYIKYLADRRLLQIGFKPEFGVKSDPLVWVSQMIFGSTLENFFEVTATEYSEENFSGNLDSWDGLIAKTL